MINVTIRTADNATPYLERALRALKLPAEFHADVAEGVYALVGRHIAEYGVTERNPFGAKSGFWQRMQGTLRSRHDSNAAYVDMGREVALRYYGGEVKPVRRKNLAIPARREAYGKSPRDFNDLRFVPTKRGGGMLVQKDQTTFDRSKESGKISGKRRLGGLVMYWLVKSVTVRSNRRVLPTDAQIQAAARRAGENFLRARLGLPPV